MGILRFAMQGMIRAYQLVIRPVMPAGGCRFHPSCSDYAFDAIGRFGPIRGGWLALKRVLRCHPWGPAGVDPVPPAAGNVPGNVPGHVPGGRV